MKLVRLIRFGAALVGFLPAARGAAQTADRISGSWVEGGTSYLQLRLEGTTKVVGTIVAGSPTNLAPIRVGSFDAKTGTLKVEGDTKHPSTGEAVHFELEGKLDRDTLRVVGTFGNSRGSKNLTRASTEVIGAGARSDPAIDAARKSFAEVSAWVAKAADLVPAEKYTYKPTATVRTFGQLVAHVVDGSNYYCGAAAGRAGQWSDANEKGATDKAAVTAKLKQAFAACTAAYANGQIGPLIENVGHTNLHYGNIVTYMRMMGMVPPSS